MDISTLYYLTVISTVAVSIGIRLAFFTHELTNSD